MFIKTHWRQYVCVLLDILYILEICAPCFASNTIPNDEKVSNQTFIVYAFLSNIGGIMCVLHLPKKIQIEGYYVCALLYHIIQWYLLNITTIYFQYQQTK